METAIILDCEYLATEDAPRRFWCGPYDPDPVVAQIGAVKLRLDDDASILDTRRIHVKPVDRHGAACAIDPFFTKLTGIMAETIETEGVPLAQALADLDRFSEGARFWSWGKDELNLMAISCYVAGVAPPIPARRFDNACKLLLQAGMPYEEVKKTRSSTLAAALGVEHPPLKAHDALDDALSVAYALQHLLQAGRLSKAHFTTR